MSENVPRYSDVSLSRMRLSDGVDLSGLLAKLIELLFVVALFVRLYIRSKEAFGAL